MNNRNDPPRQIAAPSPDRRIATRISAARIGGILRQAFDDAAAEPLPDAFEDLLRQLR